MPNDHVINHIFVMSARLVMHGPASIYELETALLCESPHRLLGLQILSLPPHAEELHLNLSVSAGGISEELHDGRVNSHLDIRVLDIRAGALEISIHGL